LQLSFLLILFMELIHIAQTKTGIREWISQRHYIIRWSIYYASIALIIAAGVFENKQFIYFQF
ncbi:MAG: MBOAT family protein, partial [Bacteroidota bacterium]